MKITPPPNSLNLLARLILIIAICDSVAHRLVDEFLSVAGQLDMLADSLTLTLLAAYPIYRFVVQPLSASALKDHLESAVSHAPVMIWVCDNAGQATFLNSAWLSFRGRAQEAELGNGWLEGVHTADRKEVQDTLREGIRSRQPFECRFRLQAAGGTFHWIALSVKPWHNPGGEPLGFVASGYDVTQDEKNLRELKSVNERFQLAIEGTNSGLWDWNAVTGETYFSPYWKAMLGFEPHELPNEFSTWENLLHPDDAATALAYVTEFVEGRHSKFRLEFRLRAKAGDYRWILSQAAAHRDKEGKVTRLTGWHVDVTEGRRESDLLRDITSQIEEVFWKTDPEKKNIFYVSPGYEKIWGRTAQSLYENPKSFIDAVLPEDLPIMLGYLESQTKGPCECEYRIRRPNGEIRWIHDRAYPVLDEAGRLVAATGVASDVTATKESEIRLENQRALREKVVSASSFTEGARVLRDRLERDIKGSRVLFFLHEPERSALRLLTLNPADPIEQRLASLELPSTGNSLPCQQVLRTKQAEVFLSGCQAWQECREITEQLGVRYCIEAPILSSQGQALGVVSLLGTDAGPPLPAEIQAVIDCSQYAAILLEREISKRQVDFERARSFAASKMASLGKMAAEIAHEVNNPLMVIDGKASLLLEALSTPNENPDRIKEDLEKIIQAGQRIAQIVRNMRKHSRNADEDPMEEVTMLSVVKDALDLAAEKFRISEVALEMSVPDTLRIRCRPAELGRVVVNLLNNALDAVKGTPEASVRVEAVEKNGRIMLSVTDSGRGIPPDVAEHIMTPFFTTKPAGSGTGLGLSISLGIVRSHGGNLYLDRGCPNTRFTLEFPAV